MAKIQGSERFSIVTDHLGTPLAMFNAAGEQSWAADLDIYGRILPKSVVGNRADCPFRYPGQYEDEETGLYYNRFRYYDAECGEYVSQDPIGLASEILNLYSYVNDPGIWIDQFGLEKCGLSAANKKLMGAPPANMKNPHRHHIVREKLPPSWKNKQAIAAVKSTQAILKKYKININTNPANFTWAQNGGGAHTQKAAINVANKLNLANAGGKSAVKVALKELGVEMSRNHFF